jgi:hypothetical protein
MENSIPKRPRCNHNTLPHPARFWAKVQKTEGCWEWLGARTKAEGYGVYRLNNRNHVAHRVAYELNIGLIPEGMQIDHLCRNRLCVNPAHMEVVTNQVNQLRSNGAGGVNARRTHCAQGHEFTPENTYLNPRGDRNCRTCRKLSKQRFDEQAVLRERAKTEKQKEDANLAHLKSSFD